jgi:hypothetical protein
MLFVVDLHRRCSERVRHSLTGSFSNLWLGVRKRSGGSNSCKCVCNVTKIKTASFQKCLISLSPQ